MPCLNETLGLAEFSQPFIASLAHQPASDRRTKVTDTFTRYFRIYLCDCFTSDIVALTVIYSGPFIRSFGALRTLYVGSLH